MQDKEYRAYNFYIKDLSQGVSCAFLREAQLWLSYQGRWGAKFARIDEILDKQFIGWSKDDLMPEFATSHPQRDIIEPFRRAWIYQFVSAIHMFHRTGRPYRSILLPELLLWGKYTPATEQYLRDKKPSFPSQISLFANELMRLGNYMPGTCALLTHASPEELLGDTKPSPLKDLWMMGHVIHDAYKKKPLIRDDETDSKFAHLMRIFRVCGTPTEKDWPGVTKLPHYNLQYPQWKIRPLKGSLTAAIPSEARDLITKLLVLNPKKRLSTAEVLKHDYFKTIRKQTPLPSNQMEIESGAGSVTSSGRLTRSRFRAAALNNQTDTFDMRGNILRMMLMEPVEKKEVEQKYLRESHRMELVDWLSDLSHLKNLSSDSFEVAVRILDTYMLKQPEIFLSDYQCVGMVCLLIASKIVDVVRITLDDLADTPEESYTVRQVRGMEIKVLKAVGVGQISLVTPRLFLRNLFALLPAESPEASMRSQHLAAWLCEIYAMSFRTTSFRASTAAVACFLLATTGDADTTKIHQAVREVSRGIIRQESFPGFVRNLKEKWESFANGPRGDEWKFFVRRLRKPRRIWKKYSSSNFGNASALQPRDVQKEIQSQSSTRSGDPSKVLPTAVALRLLNFLDKPEMCIMSRVSKRWLVICQSPSLSRGNWDLKRHKEVIDARTISRLIPRLAYVQELNLFRCKLTAASVFQILHNCQSLTKLDLSYTVNESPEEMPNGRQRMDGQFIQSPAAFNAQSGMGSGDFKGLKMDLAAAASELGAGFPKRRQRDRKDSKVQMSRKGVYNVSGVPVWEKHANGGEVLAPSLRVLNLRKAEVVEEGLKEEGLHTILSRCPNITSLNLGMLQCVTTSTISTIAENLGGRLTQLHLNSCPNINNSDLTRLASDCKAVKRLYLDMCSKINDVGITAVARGCDLEVLSLCANRVSDSSLAAIAKHCKNLRQLELSFCYLVSTDGVLEIAQGCPKITHLNLCLVDMIQDNAIERLAQLCDLEELNLRGCTHITDLSLDALAKYSKKLRVLHLLGCEKVSASTVAVLKLRIPQAKIIIW
uniref:Protein kinase domain-containing protein n=1 Tax=Amorphochlora amoebiformis TaxID=1561963 RepID=A0A7S0DRL2_9EUKA